MDQPALFAILLPIALVQLVGWATPGPNHLTIISASVSAGRGAGVKAALGIASGALTWSLIAVSGLAVVFDLFPPLFVALRLIGALYLIYLGLNAFRAARSGGLFNLETARQSPARDAPFRTAYLVMMTNPKAVLFFGAILSAFIPPDAPVWMLIIIACQIGLLGAVLNVIAALFFSAPPVMRAFQAASFSTSIVFGVLFCGLGLLVAWDVLSG